MVMAPAAPRQQNRPPLTFNDMAKRRNQILSSIAYDGGLSIPRNQDVRNSGYLESLTLTFPFTETWATKPSGAGAALDGLGIYGGGLDRITLTANSIGNLFDVSGEMAFFISLIDRVYNHGSPGVVPTLGLTGSRSQDDLLFFPPYAYAQLAAITNATPFTNELTWDIPVALNLANKPFPVGLFQTALNSQQTTLSLRFAPAIATAGNPGSGWYVPGATGAFTSASGNVAIQQKYYDPIDVPSAQPNLSLIHQWREFQVPLTADGDIEIPLPTSNYYCRIIIMLVTGAANALALDNEHMTKLQLVYGANLAPYSETLEAVKQRMLNHYGVKFPPGVYTLDFLAPSHTERDLINGSATTNLRLVVSMAGATYTGGAIAKIAIEQLIPLQVPGGAQAGVQGVAA